MSKVLLGIVVGAFAFYAWQRVHEPAPAAEPATLKSPRRISRSWNNPPPERAATLRSSVATGASTARK